MIITALGRDPVGAKQRWREVGVRGNVMCPTHMCEGTGYRSKSGRGLAP